MSEEMRPCERLHHALLAEQPKKPLTPALQEYAARAAQLMLQARKNWYAIGALFVELRESGEAEKAGINVDVFWAQNVPTTEYGVQAVRKLARISEKFPPKITETPYKWSHLDLLITYALHNNIPLPNDPGKIPIRWTDDDGKTVERPFAQCGQKELIRALGHGHKPEVPLPPLAQKLLSAFGSALDGDLGPHGYSLEVAMKGSKPNLTLSVEFEKFVLACSDINDVAQEFANQHAPQQRQATPRPRSKKKNTVRAQPR